jgi:hypothetical protein
VPSGAASSEPALGELSEPHQLNRRSAVNSGGAVDSTTLFPVHQELSMNISASTVLVTGANRGFGRVAGGAYEVLADDATRQVQAALAVGVSAIYPQLP